MLVPRKVYMNFCWGGVTFKDFRKPYCKKVSRSISYCNTHNPFRPSIHTWRIATVAAIQDPCVLSTLIELRADPTLVSRSGITPLWLALDPGHVQVLLEGKVPLGWKWEGAGDDVNLPTKCGVFRSPRIFSKDWVISDQAESKLAMRLGVTCLGWSRWAIISITFQQEFFLIRFALETFWCCGPTGLTNHERYAWNLRNVTDFHQAVKTPNEVDTWCSPFQTTNFNIIPSPAITNQWQKRRYV